MLTSQKNTSVTLLVCYWHLASSVRTGEALIDQCGLQSVFIHQIGGWLSTGENSPLFTQSSKLFGQVVLL